MKFSEYHYGVGKSLAYYPRVAIALKSANACILLCQLMVWHDEVNGDWFYQSAKDIEEITGLDQAEQIKARDILKSLGMLDESFISQQKKIYFRLNVNTIDEWLLQNMTHQPIQKTLNNSAKKSFPIDILFEAFWANYPKQMDIKEAKKAFEEINPSETILGDMLRAIDSQHLRERAEESVPKPADWLKNQSWNIPSNTCIEATHCQNQSIKEDLPTQSTLSDNFSDAFNEKLRDEYRALYQKKFGIKLSEPFLDDTEKAIQQRLSHMLEMRVAQR